MRREAMLVAGGVGIIGAADFGLPGYGAGVPILLFGVLSVFLIERAIRRYRPRHPAAFHALSASATIVCAAYAWQVLMGGPATHSTFSDVLILGGLSMWALVFALFIFARSMVYDRYQLIDIGIVLLSAVIGLKAIVFDPMIAAHPPLGMAPSLAMAAMIIETVGVALIARTVTMPGLRPAAMWLLLASITSSIAATVIINTIRTPAGMHISLFMSGYILLLACMHPSMVDLTEPAIDVEAHLGLGRATLLGGALLISPIASAVVARRSGHLNVVSFLVPTAVLTVLVIGRIRLLFAEERRAHESVERGRSWFATLLRGLSDVILSVDGHGVITYASSSSGSRLGIPSDRLLGLPLSSLVVDDDAETTAAIVRATAGSSARASVEMRVIVEHEVRTFEATLTDHVADPIVRGVVVVLHDITERKELEGRLRHQALHDGLTGLPNRTLLADALGSDMLTEAELGVLFVDLDDFKAVNDGLGHDVGDLLLCAVAERLRATVRDADMVARLGGDEFAVIVRAGCPREVGARLLAALEAPFEVCGHRIHVSASVGVAHTAHSAAELLRKADMAMYRAKSDGKGSMAVFEPDMEQRVSERLLVQMELNDALALGHLRVVYQPIYALADGRITGGEALLRWRHPTRGMLGPDRFITIAEETGLIVPIGRWVLREACTKAATWPEDIDVAVNLSARQLESDDIVSDVRQVLASTGLRPARLVLEITESMLSRDVDATAARLDQLAALGIRIAIDDFGTGYSSLSTLNRFPVNVLKIDRSFVASMLANNEASALVHVLLEMGRALHLEVVAEGIEEQEQAEALRALLCDQGQGFYFSRPLASEDFARLVRERSAAIV